MFVNQYNQHVRINPKMQNPLSFTDLKNRANRSAKTHEDTAELSREVLARLLERLDFVKIKPRVVLYLGACMDWTAAALQNRYPEAQILMFDFSSARLIQRGSVRAASEPALNNVPLNFVCMDPVKLPLADASVDLVISHWQLHDASALDLALVEIQRVLSLEGALFFTSLGPDTLRELRLAFQQLDVHPHVHPFLDMHHYGDLLLKSGFKDPVVDVEWILLNYKRAPSLFRELKCLGATNVHTQRRRGLIGQLAWQRFLTALDSFRDPEQRLPITLEVIYGHAWQSDIMTLLGQYHSNINETVVPLSTLRRGL